MAKTRKRTTTSVSTLVNTVDQLVMIAKVAGRKDLLKQFIPLRARVAMLVVDYTKLTAEVGVFAKIMLNDQIDENDLDEIDDEIDESPTVN